ncbi:MAG TPA: hypothetical protein VKS01_09225 [Bryobacteraceae bacterium]|nr:hypothetical protein [Bryobacteraceae bacterium]
MKNATRIKSYFASTVDQAIAQARAEMGNEALLLNTRKIAEAEGQSAGYEVVFGIGDAAATAAPLTLPLARKREAAERVIERAVDNVQRRFAAPAPVRTPAPAAAPPREELADEIGKLHAQIDEIRSLLMRSSAQQITIGRTVPELADVYSCLMQSGVDAALSKDIVDRLEACMATDAFFVRLSRDEAAKSTANRWKQLRFDAERLESFVRNELQRRVAIEPLLGGDGNRGAVVIMVGPTGAGKTTSIMKLAASNRTGGRRVRILTLDSSRGGQTLLHSFASNLGIGFSPVQSIHALAAMAAQNPNDLVFIDTPGYSMQDRAAELAAEAFTKLANVEVHLVAPGYMKSTDLRKSTQKYAPFGASRMLVTKLDETDTYGSVFSEAARARLALSFLANGPAMEDIRPATTEDLMALAFDKPAARAHCA